MLVIVFRLSDKTIRCPDVYGVTSAFRALVTSYYVNRALLKSELKYK